MRRLPAALALALAATGLAGVASPANAADACPNAAVRAQQHSESLPDCRAYERVTPNDKSGGIVAFPSAAEGHSADVNALTAASTNGDTLAYWSYQPFASAKSGLINTYRSKRVGDHWETHVWSPAPPHMPVTPRFVDKVLVVDATEDLRTGLVRTELPFDPLVQRPYAPDDEGMVQDIYRLDDQGQMTWESRGNSSAPVTGAYNQTTSGLLAGRSADGSSVLFQTEEKLTPNAAGQLAGASLYVRSHGQTKLVAGNGADGTPVSTCGATVLAMANGQRPRRSVISTDGSRIFFVAPDPDGTQDLSCFEPKQLYVRDGDDVVRISRSRRTVPDVPADAQLGEASADGSKVFFTSDEALTEDADANSYGMLYEYDVDRDDLRLIDPGPVVAVGAVSADGSHAYYVSGTSLKVYADGQARVVSQLTGVDPASGISEIEYWRSGNVDRRVSPDGRFFTFLSPGRLTAYDNVGFREVYRYAADTDKLICVSCRPDGSEPAAGAMFLTSFHQFASFLDVSRNMTADGRTIVFDSKDKLLPQDVNAQSDVYQWRDGKLSLISDGRANAGSFFADMSADASSIFFATTSALVGSDTDGGSQDMYVARVDGGRLEPPVPSPECAGDACQGPASAQPSVVQSDSRQTRPGDQAAVVRARAELRRPSAAMIRALGRTGRGTIMVTANQAGAARVTLRAVRGGRSIVVGRGTKRLARAGVVQVPLKLSDSARSALRRGRKLRVTAALAFNGQQSAHALVFNLVSKGR